MDVTVRVISAWLEAGIFCWLHFSLMQRMVVSTLEGSSVTAGWAGVGGGVGTGVDGRGGGRGCTGYFGRCARAQAASMLRLGRS